MAPCSLAFAVFLLQAPGHGWGVAQVQPREVKRIYWELQQTTEIVVRIVPVDSDGRPVQVDLVFQAFFPGRPERVGAEMQWPKGPPSRLALTAQAFPLTFVIPELSLRFEIDGVPVDLMGPGSRYRHVFSCPDGCSPNGLEVDLEPGLLRSLITAQRVKGWTLGFPMKLTPADQAALASFAGRIGLPATPDPKQNDNHSEADE